MLMRAPITLALTLMVNCAWGHFQTGTQLADEASYWGKSLIGNTSVDADTVIKEARFSGYVIGVHDSYEYSALFCTPSNSTRGQVLAVAAKYIKEHPEQWNQNPSQIVLASLQQAFPCKR
jgi:hypothetical protein